MIKGVFKIMRSRTGGMAQAVEHLPSKHTALSSNPCTYKGWGWGAHFTRTILHMLPSATCKNNNKKEGKTEAFQH
jgi:hypothetical protein